MTDQSGAPWWVVIGGAVPSIASGVWIFWQWYSGHQDKQQAVALTREELLMKEADNRAAFLSKENADLLNQFKAELQRKEARCAACEADRDNGWDLARWWCKRAHQLSHAGKNAQQVAENLLERLPDFPKPSWPDMSLPIDMETPLRKEEPPK